MSGKAFHLIPVIFILLVIGGISLFFYQNQQTALLQRQAMIHNKGASVMPFDLNQTTHIFKKTDSGGIQQVIAKDPKNSSQISLIRMHLKMEAELFQKGDFADPAKLHGTDMPGLNNLSKGASEIKITYSDLANGGQITYFTDNKDLAAAIHSWFDAQLSDHGTDAMGM